MKKILFLILLSSNFICGQNKDLIKNAFQNQDINNFAKIAFDDGYKSKQSINFSFDFKANEKGEIFDIDMHKRFKEEVLVIMKQVPKLNPEEYIHKTDTLTYRVEASFTLIEKKDYKKMLKNGDKMKIEYNHLVIKEYYPLKKVAYESSDILNDSDEGEVPLTENCKDLTDSIEIKKCVSSELSSFVSKNFNNDYNSYLSAGRHRIIIMFMVSKTGEIVNITARAPHPDLEKEAIRVINTFPDFYKPGTREGEPIMVKYTLPMTFNIN